MRCYITLLGMVLCMAQGHAQNLDKKQVHSSLDEFRKAVRQDFENFRQQCMAEYIEFVKNPWKAFEETKPVPVPKEEPVPPVVMPKEDQDKPIEDKPVIIEEVIKPVPVVPQPQPVQPIEEVPVVEEKTVDFIFFGTPAKVRFDVAHKVMLDGISEADIANSLNRIDAKDYDNMIIDCLALRKNLNLSDWGYLQMLKALTDHVCGKGSNESALMLAYLYMQSGYKMRLAVDGNKLYMLYASKHQIFNQPSYGVKGDVFYGVEELPSRLYICQAAFPNEKDMSLLINGGQRFAENMSPSRTIASQRFKDFKISVSVNRNLIDFYNTYPTSMLGDNFMTRWGMYANTPLDKRVEGQIYPTVVKAVKGLSQLEAANRILNLIQTGLEYEYDNKVWGRDRAFFAEESLSYPYCDCEDRAILYTRIVRDILGLDCILIYYPGHLAAAVAFTEEVAGDYIMLDNKKFVVTDPTYIGAPVGATMPEMDNKTAKVIVLKK